MLNSNGQRELAYIVKIDSVEPIPGRDRVECCRVGGWSIMTKLNQFKPGDLGIYFEIDSLCPANNPAFAFLEKKHYKIKTQKYKTPDGQFWSQGLLMHPSDFGWQPLEDCIIIGEDLRFPVGDTRFLTKELKITYYKVEDNQRKANSVDKYKKMAQRHQKLFKKPLFRWLMRRDWGKKLLFVFFGKAKDKKNGWPAWVKKTDEERVQNMPWILENTDKWIATEKIDGTSTTFTIHRHSHNKNKFDFYICSRNVVFDTPDKDCFYDTNVYVEMAHKYNIYDKMVSMMYIRPDWEWCTIQGETYGAGIQKRDYGMTDHAFAAFNLISSEDGRWNSIKARNKLALYEIPFVPILGEVELPHTMEEILSYATDSSVIDGGMREGVVFRALDGGMSFKAVSNEFLDKYHRG